jgi:hypothetical protein
MERIEVYKSGGSIHFIDNENDIEGRIQLEYGEHGGEKYPYVDYVELDDEDDNEKYLLADSYATYFDNNLELILDAKEL